MLSKLILTAKIMRKKNFKIQMLAGNRLKIRVGADFEISSTLGILELQLPFLPGYQYLFAQPVYFRPEQEILRSKLALSHNCNSIHFSFKCWQTLDLHITMCNMFTKCE